MASIDFSLFEAIAVPVVVLDRKEHVVFWNGAHAATVGLSSDDAIGRDLRDFLAAESCALLTDALASLSAGSSTTRLELDWNTNAGVVTRLALSARLGSFTAAGEAFIVMTGAPMPVHSDPAPRDVVAHAPAGIRVQGPAIRGPHLTYEEIVSQAVDAIFAIDAEQRIVLFNRGAERIFGWSAREAIGQPIDVLAERGGASGGPAPGRLRPRRPAGGARAPAAESRARRPGHGTARRCPGGGATPEAPGSPRLADARGAPVRAVA